MGDVLRRRRAIQERHVRKERLIERLVGLMGEPHERDPAIPYSYIEPTG